MDIVLVNRTNLDAVYFFWNIEVFDFVFKIKHIFRPKRRAILLDR